jgi:hypothetical protein
MKITDVLRNYKVWKADVEAVDARIKAHKELLATDNLSECGYLIVSHPIASGGKKSTSSQVEREVIMKIDCNRLTAQMIKEWIQEDESRIYMKRIEVRQIEIAIQGLTMYERSIIEWKYFEKMNWISIEMSFNSTYKQRHDVTEARIKQINFVAIEKLIAILKPFYDRLSQ